MKFFARVLFVTGVTASFLFMVACGSKSEPKAKNVAPDNQTQSAAAEPAAPSHTASIAKTRIEMKKVLLGDDVAGTIRVVWMNGLVSPTRKGGSISLDDKTSFLVDIQNGVLSTSLEDMTRLMNDRIFSYPGSPLSKLSLTAKGQQLKLTATVKKKISFPVEIVSEVGTTANGDMKLHVVSLKALKLPVKGMLGMFGVKVGDLVDAKGAKGVTVDGNDMILNIEELLPPPRKRGKLTKVKVNGGDLVETFGSQPFRQTCDHRSYLKFEGGVIEFGKLRMNDADLVLSDPDKTEWFDFNLDHYQQQLVAGINKVTPTNGLDSFVPGYAKIKAAAGKKKS